VTETASHFAGSCRELHFYRCRGCLSSFTASDARVQRCECGRKVENRGTVRGHTVYKSEIACDTRCQSATKNHCACSCNGENHGRAVYVEVADGKVVESPTNAAKKALADEFDAAVKAFHARFPERRIGEWMPYHRYREAEDILDGLRAARKANTHKGRMVKIAAAHTTLTTRVAPHVTMHA